MNMLSWLTRRARPTGNEEPRKPSRGGLSWTEDEPALRRHHVRRSKARRLASGARRRNRGRHPMSGKTA